MGKKKRGPLPGPLEQLGGLQRPSKETYMDKKKMAVYIKKRVTSGVSNRTILREKKFETSCD